MSILILSHSVPRCRWLTEYAGLRAHLVTDLPATSRHSAEQQQVIREVNMRPPAGRQRSSTEWISSPENPALEAAYEKSRKRLKTLREEEWHKKELYMEAAVAEAREYSLALSC